MEGEVMQNNVATNPAADAMRVGALEGLGIVAILFLAAAVLLPNSWPWIWGQCAALTIGVLEICLSGKDVTTTTQIGQLIYYQTGTAKGPQQERKRYGAIKSEARWFAVLLSLIAAIVVTVVCLICRFCWSLFF